MQLCSRRILLQRATRDLGLRREPVVKRAPGGEPALLCSVIGGFGDSLSRCIRYRCRSDVCDDSVITPPSPCAAGCLRDSSCLALATFRLAMELLPNVINR